MSQQLDEQKLWKAVLAEMQTNFSGLNYDMYLSRLTLDKITDNIAYVVCPDSNTKKRAETYYKPFLQDSINKIGKGTYDFDFRVGSVHKKLGPEDYKGTIFEKAVGNKTDRTVRNGLNPHYTIETYITGNTNHLAYAIASAIIQEPGSKYNPYFLYAGVGLGKTHLIQAIGNKILEKNPDANVIYCSGEKFSNELIEAIQHGKGGKGKYSSDTFRTKYRSADLLIIDDIQFIAGKESTQEEFFHTFNELYNNQKQIVLASDRPPEEFSNIEERITSRFKSGMMADIQPPDYELRTAILRAKRDQEGDKVPNEILDFIAEKVNTNIRELEAAYLQVVTSSKASNEELTIENAKRTLSNIIKTEDKGPVSLNSILKAVCDHYSLKHADLRGKRRTKEIVIPRQIAMYLMYDMTNTPFMSIGEFLGGRDHTTIMHGYEKVKVDIESSTSLRSDVIKIKQTL